MTRARIPRLAIIVLIALGSAPLLLWGAGWWQAREAEDERADRDRVAVQAGRSGGSATPTRAMTIGPSGFGTVVAAPETVAREEGLTLDRSETLAHSVAALVRAVPIPVPEGGRNGQPRICTLEGPPVWRGRLVLIDGCLRIHEEGAAQAGPLLLASVSLYRDSEDYLTASIDAGLARHEIRVGAPNTRFTGVGCSMDRPVPAPPALAKACGVTEMRRVGAMERRRYCSREDLAQRQRMAREQAETAARLKAARAACLARGNPASSCPPDIAPTPPELTYTGCLPG